MAQQVQRQFNYQTVQLIKTEPLGRGSYGAVYKAMCDDLPCAGKVLHPTLFQSNDPRAMTIMRRFQQECGLLSAIRHPNIVQYLGSYQDPETQLPVLLMELMDDSLTKFLEQSQAPLSYHTQVNICHDIALALAYLHSNHIIHRDLSSNNVLLIGAGNRAKVTDFGMSKLLNVNHSTMTLCPGTPVYMAPEALDEPPAYTTKLDTFTFGVLGIQIITRLFPDPSPRTKEVRIRRDSRRRLQEAVPETERRKSHIDLIVPTHPLLKIAKECLNFKEKDRPSAQELCHRLSTLKEAEHYHQSVQQVQVRSIPVQIVEKEKQLQDVEKQLEDLQLRKENKIRIKELQEEKQQLQQELRAKDKMLREEAERLKCEKEFEVQQLKASQAQLEQNLQQKERMIQELQVNNYQIREEKNHLQIRCQQLQQENQQMQQLKEKLTLSWKTCKAAPHTMLRGSATVCGITAYFNSASNKQVHSYNSDTEEWSTLPDCPRYYFTLTLVDGFVTAVGGSQFTVGLIEKLTNTLLSVIEGEDGRKWEECFPSMPTKRKHTAVMSTGKALVVAGGQGDGKTTLATVEVMNTDTLQWSTTSSLPHPLSDATATVCGDRVYLGGGWDQYGWTNLVFTCSLHALIQSQTMRYSFVLWDMISDLPVKASSCIILNGQLLAVGGEDSDNKTTSTIYSHNTKTNSWEVISHMPTSRSRCLVTILPGSKLMVVGGQLNRSGMGEVAIAEDN